MFLWLTARLQTRIGELLTPAERDRGEGPVPYIILVALMGIVAFGIWAFLDGLVDDWLGAVPTAP